MVLFPIGFFPHWWVSYINLLCIYKIRASTIAFALQCFCAGLVHGNFFVFNQVVQFTRIYAALHDEDVLTSL